MPTYEYVCKSCGEHLEVVQSFKDDALTICPRCEGPLRKVFGSIGISFKGSGFYRTDSRSGAGSTTAKGIGKSDSASEPGDRKAATADAGTGAGGGGDATRREPAPAAGGASTGATAPAAAAAS
jgi:putative FmdB family regulatory protein